MASLLQMRVDQVGSLLRPPALKEAVRRYLGGEIPQEDLVAAQDQAIREVVARQEAHRMPIVTDGEYRRTVFQDSAFRSLAGMEHWGRDAAQVAADIGGAVAAAPRRAPESDMVDRWPVSQRVRLVHNQPLEEYRFTAGVARTPAKVTMLSTDRISQRFDPDASRDIYDSVDAFMADLVAAQREMVGGLVAAGCPYVQIDAPSYTAYVDPRSIELMRERGEDPMANMERSIAADNAVISDFPDTTFGIHLCRGNRRGMWHREGSYDAIAERLFGGLTHHRLLLEYDTERAGGFEPLRFVPTGKTAVLGLVSTKVPEIERVDNLLRRIEEASKYLPTEQLAISPQCGFSSSVAGNPISEDDQWRKVDVLIETARRVWG